ncbi:DUF3592 domain-containing protein [Nostoc sp. NIES-2111]
MNIKLRQVTFDERFSGIYLVFFGLLMLGLSFWADKKTAHERATLTETQGRVVETLHRRERDIKDKEKDTYAPVIEFQVKGDSVRFTGYYDTTRTAKGNIVTVRYDPKQPTTTARKVEPLEGLGIWGAYAMGGGCLVYGLCQFSPIRFSLGKGE